MKTVITMTSWTKRISFVSKAIYRFLTTQTVKPDLFYLWLAEAEFPNKENDLPKDLLIICEAFNVQLKWIKDNEYCHKRWYVYPKHFDDLVISIDDDVFYDVDLIKTAKKYANTINKCIINCGDYLYPLINYNNSIERVFLSQRPDIPSNNNQLCGQCIVLPKSFPLEAISDNNINLRKKYCKKCDECWLTPFIHNSSTKIMTHKWNNKIIKEAQTTSTWNSIKKTKSLQMYIAIRCNENNYKNWFKIFPKFNDDAFKNLTIDQLITKL